MKLSLLRIWTLTLHRTLILKTAINAFARYSGLWRCTTTRSMAAKCSAAQVTEQMVIFWAGEPCDHDDKCSNPVFLHDTLADAPAYKVWLHILATQILSSWRLILVQTDSWTDGKGNSNNIPPTPTPKPNFIMVRGGVRKKREKEEEKKKRFACHRNVRVKNPMKEDSGGKKLLLWQKFQHCINSQ